LPKSGFTVIDQTFHAAALGAYHFGIISFGDLPANPSVEMIELLLRFWVYVPRNQGEQALIPYYRAESETVDGRA
jgi:hypothetical protein